MADDFSYSSNDVSRRELLKRVSQRTGVPQYQVLEIYETLEEELLNIVANGGRVTFPRFGKFYAQVRSGRRFTLNEAGEDQIIGDTLLMRFAPTRLVTNALKAPYGDSFDSWVESLGHEPETFFSENTGDKALETSTVEVRKAPSPRKRIGIVRRQPDAPRPDSATESLYEFAPKEAVERASTFDDALGE